MYFAVLSHELFIEKSEIHFGLKSKRIDGGAMFLVGPYRITFNHK